MGCKNKVARKVTLSVVSIETRDNAATGIISHWLITRETFERFLIAKRLSR